MNNLMKKISVVFAIVFVVSSMAINASAFSETQSSCAGSGYQTKVYSASANMNTNGCVSNADFSKCAILSADATKANTANSALIDRIDNALAKCGLNIKNFCENRKGSTDTAATATPSAAVDTPNTTAPTPSADTDSTATAPTDTAVTTGGGSIDNQSFEARVAALVNEQRKANGLAPLTLSSELSNVARIKSQDMHDNNYFSHTSPTYGSPFDMLKSFGVSYRSAGENIAMGYATAEAVVSAWMNSAGHRANILNASYTQIGVGYVADGNYWTQVFIG